jgi:hypothetical protein
MARIPGEISSSSSSGDATMDPLGIFDLKPNASRCQPDGEARKSLAAALRANVNIGNNNGSSSSSNGGGGGSSLVDYLVAMHHTMTERVEGASSAMSKLANPNGGPYGLGGLGLGGSSNSGGGGGVLAGIAWIWNVVMAVCNRLHAVNMAALSPAHRLATVRVYTPGFGDVKLNLAPGDVQRLERQGWISGLWYTDRRALSAWVALEWAVRHAQCEPSSLSSGLPRHGRRHGDAQHRPTPHKLGRDSGHSARTGPLNPRGTERARRQSDQSEASPSAKDFAQQATPHGTPDRSELAGEGAGASRRAIHDAHAQADGASRNSASAGARDGANSLCASPRAAMPPTPENERTDSASAASAVDKTSTPAPGLTRNKAAEDARILRDSADGASSEALHRDATSECAPATGGADVAELAHCQGGHARDPAPEDAESVRAEPANQQASETPLDRDAPRSADAPTLGAACLLHQTEVPLVVAAFAPIGSATTDPNAEPTPATTQKTAAEA